MKRQHDVARGLGELELDLPATSSSVGPARRRVDAWLRAAGHGPDVRRRVALVVSELVTNALEASPGTTLGLRVDDVADGGVVRVSVSNPVPDGVGLPDRREWGPARLGSPRGRGLAIVASLTTVVEESRDAGRLRISADVPVAERPA